MNSEQRDELQTALVDRILDGMSHKELVQFVAEVLEDTYRGYSDEDLLTEVNNYYPDLLEEQS